jgi:pyruvate,orthophosphate dikinase
VTLPEVHRELIAAAELLERDGRDIQDIEFAVEAGRLWLLQSRPAKRSARAALRAAVAMADAGSIDTDEALRRVSADQLTTVLRPASGGRYRADSAGPRRIGVSRARLRRRGHRSRCGRNPLRHR